ncbi:TonB-dependent receptor [Aureivirga sp. CE67]|uniref:TonB-dependent receptor n=1 Tax=Aureivirga sp. CE67 TaxID=1788983 RepID=UPI0018C9ECC5|nr:TonB-dependent receptor [Aureivirga sp. CE67]
MKNFILMLFAFCFSLLTFANDGKGVIRGIVLDENKNPLPGAAVMVEELGIGTMTDVNGNYLFLNVKEGEYTVKVQYLGYQDKEEKITLENNQTKELDFQLVPALNSLDEVILASASAKGQAKALNQQKTNLNITNIVSADQTEKFPDENIGDAIKRIPGIAVQNDQGEARDIIIRGLAPQLNSITLNGDRIPSAEGDNRRVQLDLIPADMIQTIEVNKALTPDMEADAIGGSVNLVTKRAPNKFRASAVAGLGQNNRGGKNIINTSALVAGRVFDNKLGIVLNGVYFSNDYGSDNVEFEWDREDEGSTPFIKEQEIRKYDVKRVRQSMALNLDYKFSNNHTIYINSIYNQRNDFENRFKFKIGEEEEDEDSGELFRKVKRQTKGGVGDNDYRRLEDQRLMKAAIGGEHLFFSSLEFDWKAAISEAKEERPNERYITYESEQDASTFNVNYSRNKFPIITGTEANNPDEFELDEISEEFKNTKETNTDFMANFRLPLITEGAYENKLKFGYKYKKKEKMRDNVFYEYSPIDAEEGLLENMGGVPLSNESNKDFYPGSEYQVGNFTNTEFLGNLDLYDESKFEREFVIDEFLPENYKANEQVNAAYAMLTQNFGKKLQVLFGVRVEATKVDYEGYSVDVEEAESIEDATILSAEKSYTNVMPNLQFRYSLNPNTILRLAFTNSLARPDYYDLVPYQNINSDDLEIIEGNPNLEATEAMNFDFMAEHYFKSVGVISGGAFFKSLDNWKYTYTKDDVSVQGFDGELFEYYQQRNGDKAKVYGFEFAIQRQLNFLPSFLKNLHVYANYTYTETEADGVEGRDEKLPLEGAARNMFNGSLSYETKKLSLRVSTNLTGSYIDEYGDDTFEDAYYDQQLFLDVNGSYVFNKKWRVFVAARNLTNQPLRYYQGIKSQTKQAEYYGINWTAGLKFEF